MSIRQNRNFTYGENKENIDPNIQQPLNNRQVFINRIRRSPITIPSNVSSDNEAVSINIPPPAPRSRQGQNSFGF